MPKFQCWIDDKVENNCIKGFLFSTDSLEHRTVVLKIGNDRFEAVCNCHRGYVSQYPEYANHGFRITIPSEILETLPSEFDIEIYDKIEGYIAKKTIKNINRIKKNNLKFWVDNEIHDNVIRGFLFSTENLEHHTVIIKVGDKEFESVCNFHRNYISQYPEYAEHGFQVNIPDDILDKLPEKFSIEIVDKDTNTTYKSILSQTYNKISGLIASANEAMRCRDWPEAAKRWALVREKYPQKSHGYLGGAQALKEQSAFKTADALVLKGLEKFPEETGLYLEYIAIARRQKNYEELARRGALMQKKIPGHPRGYEASGVGLRELGKIEESDAALLAGLEKFPNETDLYLEYVQNAIRQKSWPEAAKRWALMREKYPQDPHGYTNGALALKENGEFDAADALVLEGLGRFPKEPNLYLEYIDIARRQGNNEEIARRGVLMQRNISGAPERS